MHEIKFRAKSGTQWRYGDLYHNERGELVIYEPKTSGQTLEGKAVNGWRIKVDPETVGQFTGLYDANWREIYEGDIIKVIVVAKTPKWDFQRNFVVEWSVDGWYMEGDPLHVWILLHTLKVIGNVHDNPDLLEVAHD